MPGQSVYVSGVIGDTAGDTVANVVSRDRARPARAAGMQLVAPQPGRMRRVDSG